MTMLSKIKIDPTQGRFAIVPQSKARKQVFYFADLDSAKLVFARFKKAYLLVTSTQAVIGMR